MKVNCQIKPLCIAAATVCAVAAPAFAQPTTQSATGCPLKSETILIKAAGFAVPAVAINWTIQGMNQQVGFWVGGVQVGAVVPTSAAVVATITAFGPDDAFQAHYARMLDDLRQAAIAKRRVTVKWSTSSLKVDSLLVHWDVAC